MLRRFGTLLWQSAQRWIDDGVPRLSAALAYYAAFSIAPLLVVVVYIGSLIFGPDAAQGEVADNVSQMAGSETGKMIQDAIKATAHSGETGFLASLISAVMLLFGASAVFGELKSSLNTIWGVEARPGHTISTFIRDRLLSFSMVICVGFLLLVSLVVSSIIAAISEFMSHKLALPPWIWQCADLLVSLLVSGTLFAIIFRILPDVVLRWRDILPGSLLTAILFTFGKSAIAWYLGTSSVTSVLGAAGSLAALLLWVYYASGILFFGAEFSKTLFTKNNRPITPEHRARLIGFR